MVLLRNDGVLPWRARGRIAVVGRSPPRRATRARAARRSTPPGSTPRSTSWSPRCPTRRSTTRGGFGIDDPSEDAALAEEAVRVAAGADVVVAYLGLPAIAESEGFDRTHIDLPTAQTDLLARLGGAGAPVVVVLANGSAVRTAPWEQHAAAVLECWLGGQAVGGAIAVCPHRRCRPRRSAGRDDPAAPGRHSVVPQLPR
jgi:beta-glucosidase